jgi:hypothetical protein
MAQGKWWVTDTPQDDQDMEEIKTEVKKIGLDYLPADIKNFNEQNREDQRRLKKQRAIAEKKAIMFIISGMLFISGFNVLLGYSTNFGSAMISCAVLLSLSAIAI